MLHLVLSALSSPELVRLHVSEDSRHSIPWSQQVIDSAVLVANTTGRNMLISLIPSRIERDYTGLLFISLTVLY